MLFPCNCFICWPQTHTFLRIKEKRQNFRERQEPMIKKLSLFKIMDTGKRFCEFILYLKFCYNNMCYKLGRGWGRTSVVPIDLKFRHRGTQESKWLPGALGAIVSVACHCDIMRLGRVHSSGLSSLEMADSLLTPQEVTSQTHAQATSH